MRVVVWALLGAFCAAAPKEDMTASLPESSWFVADDFENELLERARSFTGSRTLHCLDLFGFSGKVSQIWSKQGYESERYDILRGGRSEDILGKRGFLNLMRKGLSLLPAGVIIGGPPCCMFIFLSCSVHQRHAFGPQGNTGVFKVRMANLIVRNLCTFLRILRILGRDFYVVLEQPTSSWMFKLSWVLALEALLGSICVTTWQGCFGHDLPKPTHLWGTLPNLGAMTRKMTRAKRSQIQQRLTRRNARRVRPRFYYFKKFPQGGHTGGVSGTEDLGKTADYTAEFCRSLLRIWIVAFNHYHQI